MMITGSILVEHQLINGNHVYAVYETPRKLWAFCPTPEQANLIKDLLDEQKFNDTWRRENFDNRDTICTSCGNPLEYIAPFWCNAKSWHKNNPSF